MNSDQHKGLRRQVQRLWRLTVVLITTAVTLGRSGSQSACLERWPGICADAASAHCSPAPRD